MVLLFQRGIFCLYQRGTDYFIHICKHFTAGRFPLNHNFNFYQELQSALPSLSSNRVQKQQQQNHYLIFTCFVKVYSNRKVLHSSCIVFIRYHDELTPPPRVDFVFLDKSFKTCAALLQVEG